MARPHHEAMNLCKSDFHRRKRSRVGPGPLNIAVRTVTIRALFTRLHQLHQMLLIFDLMPTTAYSTCLPGRMRLLWRFDVSD